MRYLGKLPVLIVRPIYRFFFERPLWWFLAKVKAFFFAETIAQLENIDHSIRQNQQGHNSQQFELIEQRLRQIEANNAAQWDALEQLLLAMFRQTEIQTIEPAQTNPPDSIRNTELERVHAVRNLH